MDNSQAKINKFFEKMVQESNLHRKCLVLCCSLVPTWWITVQMISASRIYYHYYCFYCIIIVINNLLSLLLLCQCSYGWTFLQWIPLFALQLTVYHKALQDNEKCLQNLCQRIMKLPGYSLNITIIIVIPCNTRNMSFIMAITVF